MSSTGTDAGRAPAKVLVGASFVLWSGQRCRRTCAAEAAAATSAGQRWSTCRWRLQNSRSLLACGRTGHSSLGLPRAASFAISHRRSSVLRLGVTTCVTGDGPPRQPGPPPAPGFVMSASSDIGRDLFHCSGTRLATSQRGVQPSRAGRDDRRSRDTTTWVCSGALEFSDIAADT